MIFWGIVAILGGLMLYGMYFTFILKPAQVGRFDELFRSLGWLGVIVYSVVIVVTVMSLFNIGSPKHSDRELFMTFHSAIMEKAKNIDATYKPFGDAMGNKDVVEAVRIAQNINGNLTSDFQTMRDIEVPNLSNDEAEQTLKDAREALVLAYSNKIGIVENTLNYAKEPSVYTLAKIQNNGAAFQKGSILGIAQLFEAAAKLGIKPEELNRKTN